MIDAMWIRSRIHSPASALNAAPPSRARKATFSTASHVIAWLCVLLVVVFGTVQVAHAHNDEAVAHTGCSLCAVAHSQLQSTTIFQSHIALAVFAELDSPVKAPHFATITVYALFTRPPPAVIPSA